MTTMKPIAALCAAAVLGIVGAAHAQSNADQYDSDWYFETLQDDRDYGWQYDAWNGELDRYGPTYRDHNRYGVGTDFYDDKWDTGFWDMGEYDVDDSYWSTHGMYDFGLYDSGPHDSRLYGTGFHDTGFYNGYDTWYTDDWWADYDTDDDGWFDW